MGFNRKKRKMINQIIEMMPNLKNGLLKMYISLKATKDPQNQNKILNRKIQQSRNAVINNFDFKKLHIFLNIISSLKNKNR